MHAQLERLIQFWEQIADNGGGGYRACASDLRRLLDTDPFTKLQRDAHRVTFEGEAGEIYIQRRLGQQITDECSVEPLGEFLDADLKDIWAAAAELVLRCKL